MFNSLSFPNSEVSLFTNPSQFNSHELVILDAGVDDIQQLIEGIKPGVDWVVLNRNQDGIEQITHILANYPDIKTLHLVSHGAPGCLFLGNTQLSLDTLEIYATQLQSWLVASPPSPQIWGSKPPSPQPWGSQDLQSAIVQTPSSLKVPIFQSPHSWEYSARRPAVYGGRDLGAEDLRGKKPSLLLYGCNVAAGDAGEELINKLHILTQANIAASRTLTGNAQQGGNWNLEVTLGTIQPELAFNQKTKAAYAGVLGAKLVKDINLGSESSSPLDFTALNGKLFFSARNQTSGRELWITDGTEAGTQLVKDINPGSDDGPYNVYGGLRAIGDKLFFQADDGTHGDELWVSDGTEAGTQLVKDINLGSDDGAPSYITVVGNQFFFRADDGTHGEELWVSDGTEAGTQLVKDINPFNSSSWPNSNPHNLTVVGNKIFFTADNETHGHELWVSDGTEAGTQLVKDINPGSDNGAPSYITLMGDKLFFSADDGTHGNELWVSDGTEAGTQLVKDINPGFSDGDLRHMTVMGDKLFFSTNDGTHGYELWVSDGTEAGTQLVKDINPGWSYGFLYDLAVMGDKLFFIADDGTHGEELWVSDGTEAGTQLVKDIHLGSDDGVYDLAVMGDKLFISASNETHGHELWVSDGTEAGTQLVKDIHLGSYDGVPRDLAVMGDKLFFRADDGTHGEELWVYTNEAPINLSLNNNDIDEDATSGTVVGDLSTTDPDSYDSHAYTLLDDAGGRFALSDNQIIVDDDSLLDYENATSHTISVRTTDSEGLSYEEDFDIYVNNINESPEIEEQSFSIAEDAFNGDTVGTVVANDADGDSLIYSIIAGNDDGIFAIDENSGEITIADGFQLDFETIPSYNLTVEVSDSITQESATITVNIIDVNEAPEIEEQSFSIAEDVSDGATVGTVTSSDVDGPTLTYSITAGNDDGIFEIDGITGEITVVDSSQIDFETTEGYDLTVEVSDSEHQTSATVTVSITDVNDAPEIEEQSFEVAEDITDGSSVGTVAAIDADADSLTYEITAGNDDGIFAIDENTGEITVADSSQIDFETTESYDLTVAVNDSETGDSASVTVNITDVNEAPEFTSTAPTNSTQGFTYTYNIVIDDPDAGENLTITAPALPNWLTLTDNRDGTATLSGTPSDAEVGDHAIELQVEDAAGEVDTQSFTLKVKNTNDAPTIIGTPDTTVNEDDSYSFVPTAEDVDGDNLSFSIQNKPDWADFNSATGALSGTPENEDVGTTENIVISVTDGTETIALNGFSLEVVNTNDAPEVDPQSFEVAEDITDGSSVGTVAASDADKDSLTYSITAGNNAGIFTIDENTGEITIADSSQLNFETTESYNLTVAVSDSETGDSATVTVEITNVNEAPTSISLSNSSIAENSPRNAIIGALSTADPDNPDVHTYTLVDNAENRFKLSGKTLIVDRGNLLDYETDTSHTIRVKTTDKQGLSYEQDLVINVEDGIIKSEDELETYLSDRRISGVNGVLVESIFDVFELDEDNPDNTPTATIEFGQQSTIGGDEQLQLSLTGLHSYPYSFTPILAALGKVPGGLGYFSDIASFLNELDVSIDLTNPTFTITDLDHAPIYEISAEVEVPEGDHFLGFIKDTLRVDVFTLKAGFNSDNKKPYIVADLDIDDITLFEAGELSLELSHANLYMETDLKGEPAVGLTPTFTVANYDPTQDDEPKLEVQGLFTFEPESITAGLRLKPEDTWKNPFSIPDTEIRDLSLELGGTYAGTGFDNVNIIGDLKFGNFDIASAFAIDVNDPNKNAILLTSNQPVDLLDLWMGPVTSYTLETIGDAFEPVQDAVDLLNDIIDVQIESIDSDNDGDLDPLIKVVPESKTIGGQTIQTGLAINGKLTAWGAEATLKVEGNPDNFDNIFNAELRIPEIDLGFGKLSGTRNSDLSLEIVANLNERYLKGDASLELFGYSVAKADVEVTPNSFTLNDFDLDSGLVALDVDNLSVNLDNKTASGRGELEIFNQSLANVDFDITPTRFTLNDFDIDLGLVALDVDDLSINWGNQTASGEGELEIFNRSVANVDFDMTPSHLTLNDFDMDLGLVALDVDNLSVNWRNNTASGSGSLEIFGQNIASTDFGMTSNSLTVNNFDLDLGLVELDINELSVDLDSLSNQTEQNQGVSGVWGSVTNWLDNTVNNVQSYFDPPTARGSGSFKIFGQSVANTDFEITPNNLTINNFDLDLGLVELDVDDLSVNWKNNTATGSGSLEIFGETFAQTEFELTPNSVSIEDLQLGFDNILSIDDLDLTMNSSGSSGSGSGSVKLFGRRLANARFTLDDGNLDVSGSLGISVLGYNLGLDVGVTLGDNPAIDIAVDFLGDKYPLLSLSLDSFAEQYTSLSSLASATEDIIWSAIGDIADLAEDLFKTGVDFISSIGSAIIDTASDLYDGFVSLFDNTSDPTRHYGNSSNENVNGNDNSDALFGNGGNDTLHGRLRPDLIDGGSGNDKLLGGNDNDTIIGGDGNDTISGQGHSDLIYGWAGNDRLRGAGDPNQPENDRNDKDTIYGGLGDDHIRGDGGNDRLYGDAGNDRIFGGYGSDTLSGGPGHDYFNGGYSLQDWVDYSYATVDINVDLTKNGAYVPGEGWETIEFISHIQGGSGNDTLIGSSGNNNLKGGEGNNWIDGGSGNDTIHGGWYLNRGVDTIDGGSGRDTLKLLGYRSSYLVEEITTGYKITDVRKPFDGADDEDLDVTIVTNVERLIFVFENNILLSVRSLSNSYIEDAEVFFDANFNGIRDFNEPFTLTEADGSFDLQIDLEQYDLNQNGVLDHTEGLIVGQGGTYVSSGLPLETPLIAIPSYEVVTPLTTLVAELVMQGIEPEAAEAQVKLALGLPADIDLGTFNYLDAAANSDSNGLKVYSGVVQVQNTIVTATKLFEGAAPETSVPVANATIEAIAAQIQNSQSLDLSQPETLDAILNATISRVSQLDAEIDTTQLSEVIAIAVQAMAQSNQLIREIANSEGALNELATDITRIQKVALGDIAESLSQLAAGTKTVEEFAAEVTPEAIQAKLAQTVVSDPTFRPEVVDDASEENIVEDAESLTDNSSDPNNTGSSNLQFIGSVIGSGSGSASETNDFDVSNSIPEIISPVQPVMAEMTASVTEATVESDMIIGSGVEPMYLLDGHDTLMADDGDNWVNGNVGNDMMDVGAGNDTVFGGKDNDTVFASAGNDWINGNLGADFLDGGEGMDTLYGGEDSDTLQGNAGNDWLSGNLGADFLNGGAGADLLFGGQDNDTLQGGADNDELFGNIGADLMEGNDGNDLLHGGQDNDTISGNSGDDTVHGDRGNDLLDGGEGDDELFGDMGDDILFGAAGNDTLTGGEGSDRFILTVGSGNNLITDFTDGEDMIVLEGGLTFEQLTLETAQNATVVKFNEEILATLNGIESGLITADDFVNSL